LLGYGELMRLESAMPRSLLMIAMLLTAMPLTAAILPNQPVNRLDLRRYSGRWHEIARLPMFFERQCIGAVTAVYTPMPDGSVHIRNSCHTRDGHKTVDGVARVEPGRPGALVVRFAPRWLSWLPLARAEYWVINVDPDYQWALVGSPDRSHLWILSRKTRMSHALLEALKRGAEQRGYRLDKLEITAPLD
jgi:apolipoprotein D and lipocalin family protein